ncbi:MAG: sugar ABC transporter ATP-binding protein [Pseudomonadota bacterium]
MAVAPILQVANIDKAFPNVRALSDVSLDVHGGEVIAFMGENGAGKSTLLKILSGDYHADSGTVTLDGSEVRFHGPKDARTAGIRVIYQEPEIIPHITVAENVFVGELPTKRGAVDFRKLIADTWQSLHDFGFEGLIDPNALGSSLSPAQRHIVEILRALKPGLKVLALDEPTSSLTDDEAALLFKLVGQLRAQGVGIIYVSHRLHEIMQIADRIAVLRDGKLVGVKQAADTSEDEIVAMMVGRNLTDLFTRDHAIRDQVVLSVENLSSQWHHDVNLTVRAGEVVGLAGLIGAGRTELAKVLFGEYERDGGVVTINGKPHDMRHPSEAIAAGMGLAPEDRRGEGLVLVRSVLENSVLAILSRLSRLGMISPAKLRATGGPLIRKLDVKTPSLDQEVGKLSGGNQQKVVLARWLAARPSVLILDEPTRGIDVGAKAEIYRLIDELASNGIAILLISSEMPELLGLADRILVMRGGTIAGELSRDEASEEAILRLAMVHHSPSLSPDPANPGQAMQ